MNQHDNTRLYWQKLAFNLISPQFHRLFLQSRFQSNFITAPRYRRLMSLIWVILVISFVTLTHSWLNFTLACLFPLTFLYHNSALLQFCSEHRWLSIQGTSNKRLLGRKNLGRFMGEAPPNSPVFKNPGMWLYWLLRMLGYHLPVRLAIITGELAEHDWHHRHPHSKDWPNGAYARQQDIEAGCPNWPEEYTEVWGLFEAVDEVFQGLNNSPSLPK
jgi:hypothetical protein